MQGGLWSGALWGMRCMPGSGSWPRENPGPWSQVCAPIGLEVCELDVSMPQGEALLGSGVRLTHCSAGWFVTQRNCLVYLTEDFVC